MNIGGIILAGGKSERMGQDKGLMLLQGKPLVSYAIEALSPLVSDMVLIAHDKQYEKFGYRVVPDLISEAGPLGGIYTGLEHSQQRVNLILSCDTPFVTTELFRYLLSLKNEHDVVVPRTENGTEPLAAVYDKACVPDLKQLIDGGNLKMRQAIQELNVLEVAISDQEEFYSPYFFDNLNTPEALKAAIRRF